ncbi:DegT/DnrJ/EryC1/StrS family aminotransferase [Candidatus Woesearchaeota archaeon]|nr:DegT/DnrJ/EryC1/StrS family aminotransferase [Candidatus Woesearchaeota archaeon]
MIKLKDKPKQRAEDEQGKKKQHEQVIALLKKLTKHKHVKLVQRGNAAIFSALCITKKINPKPFVLIPDEGGWISFPTYPKLLGFDVRKVKTNRGVIDLIDLEKKAESGAAFLVTSFAGYFAEQPMKYISRICRKNKCLLIEDASGALGDEELCDGYYSDIIVGSFGRWKPINAGYGGFISTAQDEWFEKANDAFSMTNHYPCYEDLLEKLCRAADNLKEMIRRAEEVKADIERSLPAPKIVHKDLRGLNVVVRYADDAEKKAIMGYCSVNGYDYVECPKYIRLEEEAISIELKRIEPELNGKKRRNMRKKKI